MNTKHNQRFQDNEEKIKESFISLLNIMDISEVTVRAICEKSEINRSTFYAHYQDVYDLLDKLQSEMNHKLISQYESSLLNEEFFMSDKFFIPFLEYIRKNQRFYSVCLHKRNSFPIEEGFEPLWNIVVKPNCIKHEITSEAEMMYYFVYFQAGITMVLKHWVDKGCKESPEEIWGYLRKMRGDN